jgi:hypothetical protein
MRCTYTVIDKKTQKQLKKLSVTTKEPMLSKELGLYLISYAMDSKVSIDSVAMQITFDAEG